MVLGIHAIQHQLLDHSIIEFEGDRTGVSELLRQHIDLRRREGTPIDVGHIRQYCLGTESTTGAGSAMALEGGASTRFQGALPVYREFGVKECNSFLKSGYIV